MHLPRPFAGLALALLAAHAALASDYSFRVVATGLAKPTGIAACRTGRLYFTEVPTPGVGGGLNAVKELRLRDGTTRTIHQGEPDPQNIAIDRWGILYWTCRSAGVILEQSPYAPATTAMPLLTGLAKPTDIAATDDGELYWSCKSAGVILTRDDHGHIKLLLSGLNKPVGIALDEPRKLHFWTEVPTPAVPGTAGGQNKIWVYDLKRKTKTLVHSGDPEPTDITVARNGRFYWTCTSAGVIVEGRRN